MSSTRVATLYQTWLVNKFTRPNTLADPPIGQLQTTELQTLGADPPSNEVVPSLGEVKDVVDWLKGGGSTWDLQHQCGAGLTWHKGAIQLKVRKGMVITIWKDCCNYLSVTQLSKVLAHLLLMCNRSQFQKVSQQLNVS